MMNRLANTVRLITQLGVMFYTVSVCGQQPPSATGKHGSKSLSEAESSLSLQSVGKKRLNRVQKIDERAKVTAVPSDAVLVDSILVVVTTPEGTEVITQSDATRPSLLGQKRSLDDIVFERLVFLDAKRHKALPDDDAVDRYLAGVMRDNNLSLDDIKRMFANAGYTFDEGREQLRVMQAVNGMLGNKVYTNVMVPRRDVVAYYESHPEQQPASVYVSYVHVPRDESRTEKGQYRSLLKTSTQATLNWGSPFWVAADEVAPDKQFIFEIAEGKTSEPYETTTGFELFKVIEKKPERLRTLDERYQEIADILAQPRYQELIESYKKSLMQHATVIYH